MKLHCSSIVASSRWERTRQQNGLRHDNREEEEWDEEVQIENWERPLSYPNHLHFCICSRRGGSGSADFLLPTEVGGGGAYGTSSPYPQSLERIETAERQEVWPRLDNSGGGYFWKRRAESRQGGVCSVSCWLFCQMWAAECVFMCQNELFVLRGRHTESVTHKESTTWALRWV